ncbi:hypothetical protein RI367_005189 [Sorochytrium milnesiophthora]
MGMRVPVGPDSQHIRQLRERVKQLEQELAARSFDALPPAEHGGDSFAVRLQLGGGLSHDPIGLLATPLTCHLVDIFTQSLSPTYAFYLRDDDIAATFVAGAMEPVLAYAIYAASAYFSVHPELLVHFKSAAVCSDFYARKAAAMLFDDIDAISIHKMRAIAVLTTRDYIVGEFIRAWQLDDILIRFCQQQLSQSDELGGQSLSTEEEGLYRRYLSYAYACNVSASAATGRCASLSASLNSLVDEVAIKAFAPDDRLNHHRQKAVAHCILPEHPPIPDSLPPLRACDSAHLCVVLARVLELVNAPVARRATDVEAVRRVHQELVDFSHRCPIVSLPFIPGLELSFLRLATVVQYNLAIITLHRPLALQAYIDNSASESFSAQQSLAAAERLHIAAEHVLRTPGPSPRTLLTYAMQMAGSVYMHRSISMPLTAADMARLRTFAHAMDATDGHNDLMQMSRTLHYFLDDLDARRPSTYVAMSVKYPVKLDTLHDAKFIAVPHAGPQSSDNAEVTLQSLLHDQPVLFVLLRRPGCLFCRHEAVELRKREKEITGRLGVRMVAVVNQQMGAQQFAAEYWKGETYFDPDLKLFKALGDGKDRYAKWYQMLRPMFWIRIWRLRHTGLTMGNEGDKFVIRGGLMVVGAGSAGVQYAFAEQAAGVYAPVDDVMKACRAVSLSTNRSQTTLRTGTLQSRN